MRKIIIHKDPEHDQKFLETIIEVNSDEDSKPFSINFPESKHKDGWEKYLSQQEDFMDHKNKCTNNRKMMISHIKQQMKIFSFAICEFSNKVFVEDLSIFFSSEISDLKSELRRFTTELEKKYQEPKQSHSNKEKIIKNLVATKIIKKLINFDEFPKFLKEDKEAKLFMLDLNNRVHKLITDILYKFFWQYYDFIKNVEVKDFNGLFSHIIDLYIKNLCEIEKKSIMYRGSTLIYKHRIFDGTFFPSLSYELLYWLPDFIKSFNTDRLSRIIYNVFFAEHEKNFLSHTYKAFKIHYQKVELEEENIIASMGIISTEHSTYHKGDPIILLPIEERDSDSKIVHNISFITQIQKNLTEDGLLLYAMIQYVTKYFSELTRQISATSALPAPTSDTAQSPGSTGPSIYIEQVGIINLPPTSSIGIKNTDRLVLADQGTLAGNLDISLQVDEAKLTEIYKKYSAGRNTKITAIPTPAITNQPPLIDVDTPPLSPQTTRILDSLAVTTFKEDPSRKVKTNPPAVISAFTTSPTG